MVAYQENREYDTYDSGIDANPLLYARPGHRSGQIDLPQRFGELPFWTVHPGQSYIRLDPRFLSLGLSTENLWWGPGVRNSILMSNTGAGFPHAFVGTPGAVDIWLGEITAEAVWGHLKESDHFDADPENDKRLFQALIVSFSPRGAEQLHLGAARVFYQLIPPEGFGLSQYLRMFETPLKENLATPENPLGDDRADQMFSVFGRWAFPAVGLEVYGEWARNDHSWDFEDFVAEVDHSQGYTLGLQKLFGARGRWLRLTAELTHLSPSLTLLQRGTPPFYAHRWAVQGYTHQGQLLGAGLGPGGDGQYLGLDAYHDWGRIGLFLELQRRNGHAYLRMKQTDPEPTLRQEVDLGIGMGGVYLRQPFLLNWSVGFYHRWHPYFNPNSSANNAKLQLQAEWIP